MFTVLILSAIDIRCDAGKPCYKVHRIIEQSIPIIFFTHALCIALGKLAFGLQAHDGNNKLRHGVRTYRQRFYRGENMIGHMTPALPYTTKMMNIFFTWESSYQHQVK